LIIPAKLTDASPLFPGRSASFDLEKSMISKLKTECGAPFTNKLEGMFKDIDLSRELMSNYTQHLEGQVEDQHKEDLMRTLLGLSRKLMIGH
jgi:hypothetical protein